MRGALYQIICFIVQKIMDTYARLVVGCIGISIGISLFVTHQKNMQELAYIPAQFTTQSVKTSINACLTTADMPSIV